VAKMRNDFSKTQLKRASTRRCTSCTSGLEAGATEQELRAKGTKLVVGANICWGCDATEPSDSKFSKCSRCVEEGLVPCRFCSKDCMQRSWPRHKAWHKEQAKMQHLREPHLVAEVPAAFADDPAKYNRLIVKAKLCEKQGNTSKAAKLYQQAILAAPQRPEAYGLFALSCVKSGDLVKSLQMNLCCLERAEGGSTAWLNAAVHVFVFVSQSYSHEGLEQTMGARREAIANVPKPAWWSKVGLCAVAREACTHMPESFLAWKMRAEVVTSLAAQWKTSDSWFKPPEFCESPISEEFMDMMLPTPEETREAALCYQKMAKLTDHLDLELKEECLQKARGLEATADSPALSQMRTAAAHFASNPGSNATFLVDELE